MPQDIDTQERGEIVWGDPRTNANDFNMNGTNGLDVTAQDANNFELSLLYLQTSPTASSWIDQASGNIVQFDHAMQDGRAFVDGSGVIWNPDIGFQLDNGEIISPSGVLAAEFAHSVLPGALDPNPTPDPIWSDSSEAIAHQAANVAYAELGEPNRPDYFQGDFLDVPGVTSHGSEANVFGTFDTGSFDAVSFAADYGVTNFGYDSGFGSGSDSFGGYDSFGFDTGSFIADYGIGDYSFDSFGSGGSDSFGSGSFSDTNYLANTLSFF